MILHLSIPELDEDPSRAMEQIGQRVEQLAASIAPGVPFLGLETDAGNGGPRWVLEDEHDPVGTGWYASYADAQHTFGFSLLAEWDGDQGASDLTWVLETSVVPLGKLLTTGLNIAMVLWTGGVMAVGVGAGALAFWPLRENEALAFLVALPVGMVATIGTLVVSLKLMNRLFPKAPEVPPQIKRTWSIQVKRAVSVHPGLALD